MAQGWLQIVVFLLVLTALVPLVGTYIAARLPRRAGLPLAASSGRSSASPIACCGCGPEEGQDWKGYARSIVVFSLLSWLVLYLILRTQSIQPLNPEGFGSGPWNLSFNTASSFVTNTNWQYYGGETTLTYFAQMAGLTVQNFVSAAVGIAVLAAVIRGFAARSGATLGNFWSGPDPDHPLPAAADLARSAALVLVSQGAIQTLDASRPSTRSPAARRPWRSARSPRRRRSRSSAPTAAASSTSTAPTRSRTRAPSPTSSSCC